MTARTRSRKLIGALGAAVLVAAAAYGVPALGQTSTPTVSAEPASELVNHQYVDVAVTGERPGYVVRIRECPAGATDVVQCKADSQALKDPGDSRLLTAGSDGTGSTPFVVLAGTVTGGDGHQFQCDHDHPCELDAFATDDYGNDIGFSDAARSTVQYGASTVACPVGAAKTRIAGSGATSPAADVVEWESERCNAPYNLNVSYAITNSPNGKSAFINGLTDSDFAISTIPLKTDEAAQLKQANRDVLQIPITIGSLSFVYSYYEVISRCNGNTLKTRITDLRLSPPTIIGILTGHITDMSDAAIAADNPDLLSRFRDANCQPMSRFPVRGIQPVGRADNSGATWTLSSWALANAKSTWESNGPGFQGGPTEIFPAGNGVDLRTGNAAVATDVRTAGGVSDENPNTVWIGYVDSSVARQLGLPSVAVKTAAGSWVKPTTDTVKAALAAGTLNQDGTITPTYTPTDPNAYPLLTVSYLITDKAKLTQARSETMKAFATYAITDGQNAAELRGYIPLSEELKTSAAAQVAEITYDPNAVDPGTGKKHKHKGSKGSGDTSGLPVVGGQQRNDGSSGSGGPADTGLGDVASSLLDSSLSGAHLTAAQLAAISPIEGGPVATQTLGPAGGPAGVVRALTVFLGVPMLLALGILFCFIGFVDKIGAFVRARVSVRERRLSWRAI